MIELIYNNGAIFTYDIDDWILLRKHYRIIGEIVGHTNFIPSLPVKILPEEALLLLENKIVNVMEISQVDHLSAEQKSQEFEDGLLQSQIIEYKKIRKRQLESMLDKIVEKRRKVNDSRTAEEILNAELEKSTVITKDNMIWPILLKPLNDQYSEKKFINVEDIKKLSNNLKCSVYRDLWEKGYYITEGCKFGGDFLVYLGDPICYHAIFIIRCVEAERRITPTEIVAFGRLGTSVKKRAVLASLVDDKISYITISWIDA